MKDTYLYTSNARVFKKSYGGISLTVVLELPPKGQLEKDSRKIAVGVLQDEISNLLNDSELDKMLRKGNTNEKN